MLDYSCPLQAAREHPGQSNVRIQTSVRVHARIKVCDVCLSNVNLSEQRWVNLSERHRHCTFRVETMPHVSGAKRPPKSLLFPAERMCATPEAGRCLKRSVPHSILVGLESLRRFAMSAIRRRSIHPYPIKALRCIRTRIGKGDDSSAASRFLQRRPRVLVKGRAVFQSISPPGNGLHCRFEQSRGSRRIHQQGITVEHRKAASDEGAAIVLDTQGVDLALQNSGIRIETRIGRSIVIQERQATSKLSPSCLSNVSTTAGRSSETNTGRRAA